MSHYYLDIVCVFQTQIIREYWKWVLQYFLNIAGVDIQRILKMGYSIFSKYYRSKYPKSIDKNSKKVLKTSMQKVSK